MKDGRLGVNEKCHSWVSYHHETLKTLKTRERVRARWQANFLEHLSGNQFHFKVEKPH